MWRIYLHATVDITNNMFARSSRTFHIISIRTLITPQYRYIQKLSCNAREQSFFVENLKKIFMFRKHISLEIYKCILCNIYGDLFEPHLWRWRIQLVQQWQCIKIFLFLGWTFARFSTPGPQSIQLSQKFYTISKLTPKLPYSSWPPNSIGSVWLWCYTNYIL